jgi:ABC-type lipoprotein export system ATPase subunit
LVCVSLAIRDGEFVGITGPSGSGHDDDLLNLWAAWDAQHRTALYQRRDRRESPERGMSTYRLRREQSGFVYSSTSA